MSVPTRSSSQGKRRWLDGLAGQGALALIAVFATLLIGFAIVMNTYGRRLVAEESQGRLEETGRAVAEALAARPDADAAVLGAILADWRSRAGGPAVLIDGNGATLVADGGALPGNWISSFGALPPSAVAADGRAKLLRRSDLGSEDSGSVGFVFDVPGSDRRVLLSTPRAGLEQAAERITRSLALLIAGILAVVLLPAYFFVSTRLLRPVSTLAQAAEIVGAGDLGIEVNMAGRNEIAELTGSFNRMVESLRSAAKRLNDANAELGQSLRMTDSILDNVQEGLFLLDPDLRIAPRYSAALSSILSQKDLAGASLPGLLSSITPQKTQELTARFLKLLFQADKPDSVIGKINPLREVETSFADHDGRMSRKYLAFRFERVREGSTVHHAMVTVSDVTARVELARQLEESRQRAERQGELITSILHVDPRTLREFIETSHEQLEGVNQMLREGAGAATSGRSEAHRQMVDEIYRVTHTIKGTASLLGIDFFADAAHRLENELEKLRRRSDLRGDDFIPAVLELSRLLDSMTEMRELTDRLGGLAATPRARTRESDALTLRRQVERFLGELAERHGKRARLRFEMSESLELAEPNRVVLRDAVSQLVRNAVVHGLETPAERLASGKAEEGELSVSLQSADGRLRFQVRDDGRGLDYARIANRALELLAEEPALTDQLIDRQRNEWRLDGLAEILFHPRFSTAEKASGDAGRGVGLGATREAVQKAGGTITLRHEPGRFCEFAIDLPTTAAAVAR